MIKHGANGWELTEYRRDPADRRTGVKASEKLIYRRSGPGTNIAIGYREIGGEIKFKKDICKRLS